MKVGEIMRRQVTRAVPTCTLQKAASVLRDEDIQELPVCGEDDILLGLITDRDLAIRAVAYGIDPSTTLAEILPGSLFYCFDDEECRVARKLMTDNRVSRLPVTDSRKHLVGMVLLADLDGSPETR